MDDREVHSIGGKEDGFDVVRGREVQLEVGGRRGGEVGGEGDAGEGARRGGGGVGGAGDAVWLEEGRERT